jgi:hypothetical protein
MSLLKWENAASRCRLINVACEKRDGVATA